MHGVDIGRRLSLDEIDLLDRREFKFAVRYYAGVGEAPWTDNPKTLTSEEVAYLGARRMGIVTVFQNSGNSSSYFTYSQGLMDGKAARAFGLLLGQPLGTPIFFAVDTDFGDPSGLTDYFNGVYQGLDGAYDAAVYGEFDVVKFAREHFPALTAFWQTYAWSRGEVYWAADYFQHRNGYELAPGLVVDLNTAHGEIPWRLR